MKDKFTDANFPRTADGRVYHLGLRTGEIANRIVTVGSSSRAETISQYLDSPLTAFKLISKRDFLTITGRYKGVPISIVSIGMGYPNMDFFVREARDCLMGDMVIIRLGSCGGLTSLPVGSVVVPSASVGINRNYNFHFGEDACSLNERPYLVSRLVKADGELHAALAKTLLELRPPHLSDAVEANVVNASADSFYSSQGRQTSFPDHNENLIQHLIDAVPGLASLEMETFHLFHLASVWKQSKPKLGPPVCSNSQTTTVPPPPNHFAATTSFLASDPSCFQSKPPTHCTNNSISDSDTSPLATSTQVVHDPATCIRAASAQMIFASRATQEFISPEHVEQLQLWTGRAVLETLVEFKIEEERVHEESGSVWERKS